MTDLLTFVFVEAATCALLYRCARQGPLLPAPHGLLIFCAYLQAVLYLQSSGITDFAMLRLFSSYVFEARYGLCALSLLLLSALVAAVCPRGRRSIAAVIASARLSDNAAMAAVAVIYAHLIIFMALLDWDKAWLNHAYMLMGDDKILLRSGGIFRTIGISESLFAIVTSTMLFFLLFTGRRLHALALLPAFLFHLAYQLGSHSRLSMVMLAGAAALAATIGRNYRWSAVLGAGAAVALFQALAGRGSGAHGLSQLPRAPELAARFASEQPLEGIGNLGEGIFSTAEIFVSRPDYDSAYALLSFSPLFSAVDGFSALREQNLLSLHQYVPMSALHESYSFGIGYFLVFIAVQLAAIFLTARSFYRTGALLPAVLNCVVCLGFMLQFTYPVRNVFRFFFFPAGIAAILAVCGAGSRRAPRTRPPLRARATRRHNALNTAAPMEAIP